jgi:HD-GYP domain-containing protein (c-di-GMP phosphodiesterase class II)
MIDLKLSYPVNTLDNQTLLLAGTVLSTDTLGSLISSNKTTTQQVYSLLKYGSVQQDLINFLSQPPYSTIFSTQEQITELLNLTEKIDLDLPFLQSLDYFKQQDLYTYRHILTVFALSTVLIKDLVSDYKDLIHEATSGPTHDLGKICVPVYILKKSTILTRAERDMLTHHSAAGYVLLCYYLKDPQSIVARVAGDHHERKNGSGYPRGIEQTDLLVEIVAVSDVYDALIAPRPYRPTSYENRTALEEITSMAERDEVSWDVVKALVARNRKDKLHFSESRVSPEKRGSPPKDNLYGLIAKEEGISEDDGDTSGNAQTES